MKSKLTVKQFYCQFQKIQKMTTWGINRRGWIRNSNGQCPIEAVLNAQPDLYLSAQDQVDICTAVDRLVPPLDRVLRVQRIRKRILQIIGGENARSSRNSRSDTKTHQNR